MCVCGGGGGGGGGDFTSVSECVTGVFVELTVPSLLYFARVNHPPLLSLLLIF